MWAALSKFVEEDDYENIVKTCTAALEEGGAEAKSALDGRLRASLLRAICVAKIYMEDFEGALKSAEEAVASAKNEPPCIAYEKAYCLMRLGRLKDALATAVEGEANDAGEHSPVEFYQLKARCEYRLHNYASAAALYQKVLDETDRSNNDDDDDDDDEEEEDNADEIRTNLAASLVCANRPHEALAVFRQGGAEESDDTPYEFFYNKACAEIDSGELIKAQRSLDVAETIAKKGLDEAGADESTRAQRLAIIKVQQTLVDQLLGGVGITMDGVTREYEKVLGTNPKDESVRAVANLNIVATRAAGSGLFDSYKRLKKLHEKELNPRQRRAVALNRAILQMHMGKVDDCRASLKELMSTGEKAPGQDMDLVLVDAALRLHEKDFAECEQILLNAKKNSSLSTQVDLALVQVALLRDDVKGALNRLSSLVFEGSEITLTPAGAATLVALCERLGESDRAVEAFESAVRNAEEKSNAADAMTLLTARASKLMRDAKYSEAAQAFAKILGGIESAPSGIGEENLRVARSNLVLALVRAALSSPEDSEDQLKESERLCNSLGFAAGEGQELTEAELDALEATVLPQAAFFSRAATKAATEGQQQQQQSLVVDEAKQQRRRELRRKKTLKARAKKREAYLARLMATGNYDELNTIPEPDPERWVPRRLRKSSSKRGRRRHQQNTAAGGHQGGALSAEDMMRFDAAARAEREAAQKEERRKLREAEAGKKGKKKKKGSKSKRIKGGRRR
eukprot:g1429.t1